MIRLILWALLLAKIFLSPTKLYSSCLHVTNTTFINAAICVSIM